MNEKTQKLTFGALLVAVFGVLLVLNRQTGAMLEESFVYLFPIPMVAFSARYGWKDSLPVFFCTVLISVFCGIFSSAFYAVTQSFIGMVYGSCLHAKRDMNRTMLLVMALSGICSLLSSVVLASLFGINLQEDVVYLREAMMEAVSKAGGMGAGISPEQMKAMELLLTPESLMRLFIISMLFMGIVQGFIVCQLSVLILRRLRFPIRKPAPVTSYYPPAWTGILSLVMFLGYGRAAMMPQMTGREELIRVAVQCAGLCGCMYLMFFGVVALALLLRAFGPGSRILTVILAIVLFLMLPQIVMFLGAAYISFGLHDWVLRKIGERAGREERLRKLRREGQ